MCNALNLTPCSPPHSHPKFFFLEKTHHPLSHLKRGAPPFVAQFLQRWAQPRRQAPDNSFLHGCPGETFLLKPGDSRSFFPTSTTAFFIFSGESTRARLCYNEAHSAQLRWMCVPTAAREHTVMIAQVAGGNCYFSGTYTLRQESRLVDGQPATPADGHGEGGQGTV